VTPTTVTVKPPVFMPPPAVQYVDTILRMNTNEGIEALDAEIATLKQVKAILEGDGRNAAASR
jgi:hypothetical protein